MSPALTIYTPDGTPQVAEFRIPLSVVEIEAADNIWRPIIIIESYRLLQAGTPLSDLPEHKHWMWRLKAHRYHATAGYTFAGIYHMGEAQGLMLINTARLCREASQTGQALAYIDYVSSAPWNLPSLVTNPRYRGVGKALIRAAISLSEAEGFDGRIGLHSLPQAEAFYRDTCGMTNLGIDRNEHDLRYFEMTAAQVAAFSAA